VMPVTATRLTQPAAHLAAKFSLLRILRRAPVAGASALLTGLAMGAFWSMGPVYASRAGHGGEWVALFMSAGILGGALLQWPLGVLSDRLDRRTALAIAASLAALSALPLLWGDLGETAAVVTIALFGGFAFAIYPMAVAHLVDHLSAEDIVAGSSTVLLLHGVGAAVGPLAVGLSMAWLGAAALPGKTRRARPIRADGQDLGNSPGDHADPRVGAAARQRLRSRGGTAARSFLSGVRERAIDNPLRAASG